MAEAMIRGERELNALNEPVRDGLRKWVRLTYTFFNCNPDEFTFSLSAPHVGVKSDVSGQAETSLELIEKPVESGEVRSMQPRIALSHFASLMLNFPRLIHERLLEGPASRHAEEVAGAGWTASRPVAGGT
jgi:hypothetical protein